SDRSLHLDDPPIHRYDLTQDTLGAYFMETVAVLPTTDLSFGARLQSNHTTARDRLDPTAPGTSCPFCTPDPQGLPLDKRETQHALHLGLEHRFNDVFSVFGRAARSFRLPTVDERIGMAPSGFGIPTNFDLKTQTSHDVEGGVRWRYGAFSLQTSVYDMRLRNELFFSPATFTNVNSRPTPPLWYGDHRDLEGQRYGAAQGRARLYTLGIQRRAVCRPRRAAGLTLERQCRRGLGRVPEISGVRRGRARVRAASH